MWNIGTVIKYDRKIVEKVAKSIPHDRSLSWRSNGSGGVSLFL
jgi:hypothetical protein